MSFRYSSTLYQAHQASQFPRRDRLKPDGPRPPRRWFGHSGDARFWAADSFGPMLAVSRRCRVHPERVNKELS